MKDVRAAFAGLKGVKADNPEKDIDIKQEKKGQTVTFKSSNAKLTEKDLTAAVDAKKKGRYKVKKVSTS